MPRLTKKILDAQKDVLAINENFDNIALDLSDARGFFSGKYSATYTIASGSTQRVVYNMDDSRNLYQAGRLPAIFRWTMYVDNNNNELFSWPLGQSMTNVLLKNIQAFSHLEYTTSTLFAHPNTKGTFSFMIINNDTVPHTFYTTAGFFYLPGPDVTVNQGTVVLA